MKQPELLKSDAHRNRRDQKLFGKWPGETLKNLIVAALIKGAEALPLSRLDAR